MAAAEFTAITEVAGMEGDTVVLTDIFKFEQTGVSQDGKVLGDLKPTGIRPLFTRVSKPPASSQSLKFSAPTLPTSPQSPSLMKGVEI